MTTAYKNKIAINFTLSTALLVAVVFVVVYCIVDLTVFNRLERDLNYEAKRHFYEVAVREGQPSIADREEWLEREHQEFEINPVFVQLDDLRGHVIEKSPNLKRKKLQRDASKTEGTVFLLTLEGQSVVQTQLAIKANDKTVGYLIVALPVDESEKVLSNLKKVLLASFPVVLLVLFFVTRLIAGRSIQPVISVINTASKINNENLDDRVPLPKGKDELMKLVVTINDLLDRIGNAVEREKQFTSDASHELRTPLAVIKGTLEVLIRKPRTAEEYIEKVTYCIKEIDRINHLVDQLLTLARFESQKKAMDYQAIDLSELTEVILLRQQQLILDRDLSVDFIATGRFAIHSDPYMIDIIIENLISNAIKYSRQGGLLRISIDRDDANLVYSIEDQGIGISRDEISKIMKPFYRSHPLDHPDIKGNGLGLSIVRRMCDLLKIEFFLESQLKKGTKVSLTFDFLSKP